ncbi:hypothetical protein CR162_06240 [Pseudoroseomonas rhizosphaerae]|uniref:DUF2252 domain-containing protein n=1 Tax=Teichococcus rhizosphaerae TaxID=1335062 RepID=A0A2C7AD13_9PROT|nr:DUF2252 family protein [Pseudoroseomonas rhizosphaerae]PHK95929.1 hypothetical protein CR162_06240 [Pseudoroseomonas rhizosphaerae]
MDILVSNDAYEAFLRAELGHELVEEGLAEKRLEMAGDAFGFLRATYFRWAETALELFPELAGAPTVLAVGDIHLENFGTWRDAEGRLVWGVNDYDEAAEMPYALDLVRLATSGLLASPDPDWREAGPIAERLLDGYAKGLRKPGPTLLDRDHRWLRHTVMVPDEHRDAFWQKLKKKRKHFGRRPDDERPVFFPRYEAALRAALPQGAGRPRFWYRSAGLGSLGRPRWVAQAKWRGDWVLREAKAVLPSAWVRLHGRHGRAVRCLELASGRHRAPDPWYRVNDGVAVRRLSPNNRKIETDRPISPGWEHGPEEPLGREVLLGERMLRAMGREMAAIHLGAGDHAAAIRADLAKRPAGWLREAALRAAQATAAEHRQFAAHMARHAEAGPSP